MTPRRVLLTAGLGILAGVELLMLVRLSALTALNSDHVQAVVEASDVLRGNVLLDGWLLARQNYYLTDLPFFVATRLLFGDALAAIYAAPVAVYLFLLTTAGVIVWRAADDTRARAAGVAALVVLIGMPAPEGLGRLVMVGTQHISAIAFCLLAWLALDAVQRAGRIGAARRWFALYVLATFVAVLSDPLVYFIALIPTVVVLAYAAQSPTGRALRLRLIAATLAAAIAASLALMLIEVVGGFTTEFREPVGFFAFSHFATSAGAIGSGMVRLAGIPGVALLLVALVVAVRRGVSGEDPGGLRFMLALAALLQLASCLFSEVYFRSLTSVEPLRFLVPVVLIGGVLSALELPDIVRRIAASAPRRLLIGLCGLVALQVTTDAVRTLVARWDRPPALATHPAREVGEWLAKQGLTFGFGTFWEGHLITVLTHEQVAVRAITSVDGKIVPQLWVTKPAWYADRPQFVIFKPGNTYDVTVETITATYGTPRAIERIAGYEIALLSPAGP